MTPAPLVAMALAMATWFLPIPTPAWAGTPPSQQHGAARPIDDLLRQITEGSFDFVDETGKSLLARRRGDGPVKQLTERAVVDGLTGISLTVEQAAAAWSFVSIDENAALATLPVVKAFVAASKTPKAREAMWSVLSSLTRAPGGKLKPKSRDRSLLTVFEKHRDVLLPALTPIRETEGAGDEMMNLLAASRVFGADTDRGLAYMLEHNPAAVARRMERERERGRPVPWEKAALAGLLRWKDKRLPEGAEKAPRTLADLDAASEAFITIFNCLHSFEDRQREQMLRGLGPAQVFNAVVGGEQELYRLGTSGYRDFLHPIILKGIKASGSFEAFLAKATPRWLGDEAASVSRRRGMVLVRIASSFGFFDEVLETIGDRDKFVAEAIASLGDPTAFESSSAIVVDVLTGRIGTPRAVAFRKALLDQLYERYGASDDRRQRGVYGAMLSVYQTMTGDRRVAAIDTEYPLDQSMIWLPFERLFEPDAKRGHIHRIFMRLDEDQDSARTYASFRTLMSGHGAAVRDERHYSVFRLTARRRTIEIYTNKPDTAGTRQGIADITEALRGRRVETIIGRGHTGIIAPLKKDGRRVLGERTDGVTMVFLGTCGGDASVRDMIGTFGYVAFVTSKSTGRQILNNAFVEAYVSALLAMAPNELLSVPHVVEKSMTRFIRAKGDEELREDAGLYRVNAATVFAARLFDTHVRRQTDQVEQADLATRE